jgi:hypothetical protein
MKRYGSFIRQASIMAFSHLMVTLLLIFAVGGWLILGVAMFSKPFPLPHHQVMTHPAQYLQAPVPAVGR